MEFLADHAARQPEKVALRVSSGAAEPGRFEEWTFARLHAAVLALSARLRELAPPGERALILLPSGEKFVIAFLACLHAGIVAVPAYPPRRNRHRERIVGIHDNAGPALILTTPAAEALVRETLPATTARVLALDGADVAAAPSDLAPLLHADGIAFLQYTSGSTSAPKGTVITHANLLANLEAIQAVFAHAPEHELVSWLPPYHDMGLFGCLFTPIRWGMTATLLTPEEFLRTPIRWLEVIAARQAEVSSGGPNFGYQLLADRVPAEALAALDLRRWRIAWNGAEPIPAATLERFAEKFAPCGFRPEAWLPCYGLAESTLLATGRRGSMEVRASEPLRGREGSPSVPTSGVGRGGGGAESGLGGGRESGGGAVEVRARREEPSAAKKTAAPPPSPAPEVGTFGEAALPLGDASGVLHLDRTALEQGRVALVDGAATTTTLVSCGPAALDTHLTIHDLDTGAALDAGRIGEIWIASPSVARGYWRNAEATAAAFPQPGTLRTGDLGFLHAGELYVTGRVKDLIILRGRNLHPHDVEAVVAAHLPATGGANSIAAFEFAQDGAGSAALGLLLEAPRTWVPALRRAALGEAAPEIVERCQAIRQAVAEAFEAMPALIAFVAPGDFPRTSSGKVQRAASRAGVLNGSLPVLFTAQLGTDDRGAVNDGSRGFQPTVTSHDGIVSRSDTRTASPVGDGKDETPSGSNVAPRRDAFTPEVRGLKPTATFGDRSAVGASRATADALIAWLRDFARRRLNSQLMDERRTVTPHVVLEFGNHGLFGLEVPRELGGLGLTTGDLYRVMEQLAAIDLTLALLVGAHNGLGLRAIHSHGTDEVRTALVPAMAAGRHLTSFAATERSAGSNPKTITTVAVQRADGGWVLNGRKQWIGTASWAGTIVVIAKAQSASGESLGSVALAVSSDAEGVSFGPEAMTMGMRGIPQLPVFFENVRVEAGRVLGEIGRGFDVAFDAMRRARLGLAAFSLGAMKRCLQLMAAFAGQREVAGGRLAGLPATQARFHETVCAIAAVETLVRTVAGWLDEGEALPEEVYLVCKTTAPELLGETADRALQMLGARGYMENNGLTQLVRDARVIRIFEGPTEALNASLGARLRRQSDLLCDWLAPRPAGAEGVRALRALAGAHSAADDVALGELASWTFLRWMVAQSGDANAEATAPWLDRRLRRLRESLVPKSEAILAAAELAARMQREIGAFDQTLPGEDRELDPLLRLAPAPDHTPSARANSDHAPSDRGAVNDRSRGLQTTVTSHDAIVSRSDIRTTGPGQDKNDDPPSGSNVAPRRTAFADEVRGLIPTATIGDRSAVGEIGADRALARNGAILAQLERGLLAFLEREKLGRLSAIPPDATFSSLGIDSLAAAQLAIEIEQTFGIRITEETLYDYQTLRALAGYIVSRTLANDDSAPQSAQCWQRTMERMNERMNKVKAAGNFFFEISFDAQDGSSVTVEGKRCVVLSSYSYLGLLAEPAIAKQAAMDAERFGSSSHGSRLLATGRWHKDLEARIAATMRAEDCITFGNGFGTNWAVISALMEPEDTVLADEWIHASLVDGCRASGAKFTFFRHNNLEHLAELLAAPAKGKTLVVIDAVYSMEGDIAPLPEISALAHAHGAWLMVDEAHSLGVLGTRGLGIQEHFDLPPDAIDIKMGTLSKTIPSSGGYIAGSAALVSALRHNVRSYIFSSAPTPPQVAAAIAGFDLLLSQPERVQRLRENVRLYRDGLRRIGLTPPDTGTAIVPLLTRDEASTFTFAQRCRESGLFVTPIVFPAVPQNAPRIRTTITAALSAEDISFAVEVIARHAPGLLW